MTTKEPHNWAEFIVEGDILFNYMVHNFNDMFEGESKLRHFFIRSEGCCDNCDIDVLNELYGTDIQKEAIIWIKDEFNSHRLFTAINWKPFRDRYAFTDMYLGYKKLFQYKQFYFQLAIENRCEYWDSCNDCKNNSKYEEIIHFDLSLYGWKEENNDKIQPHNRTIICPDNLMPECDWKRK